jgi:3-mercaptopyruvate sulfurtransferase SseA
MELPFNLSMKHITGTSNNDFLAALDVVFNHLQMMPQVHAVIYGDVRRAADALSAQRFALQLLTVGVENLKVMDAGFLIVGIGPDDFLIARHF